jgi:hypothetical protein
MAMPAKPRSQAQKVEVPSSESDVFGIHTSEQSSPLKARRPARHNGLVDAPKELGGLSPANAAYRAKLQAYAISENKAKAQAKKDAAPKKKQGQHGKAKKTLFKLEQRAVERTNPSLLEAYESEDEEALKRINSSVPVVLDPPRKTVFKTVELTTEICFAIANGANPSRMCADNMRMPSYTTLYAWLAIDPAFKAMWDTAMVLRSERLVDEILEIADDGSNDYDYVDSTGVAHVNGENIARAKLRVDTRKWLASKLLPKKYGDKTILSGDEENPLQIQVGAMVASSDDLLKKIRGITVEGTVSEVRRAGCLV